MKQLRLQILFFIIPLCITVQAQQIVFDKPLVNSFSIIDAAIYVDANDIALVKKSAQFLQQDIETVTGKKLQLTNTITSAKNIYAVFKYKITVKPKHLT